jgi:hypothetical protein
MNTIIHDLIYFAGGVIAAAAGLLGVRFTSRSADKATATVSDANWNALYRAAAEEHLKWDRLLLTRLERLEHKAGIDEPIPDPPSLFPKPQTANN